VTADTPGRWQGALDREDLCEHNTPADPLQLFSAWLADAEASDIIEPTAMTLATTDPDGTPSARMVLLKGHGTDGFHFYTNYHSRKAGALAANPAAALVFWWDKLERQVRITGTVNRLPPQVSDAYYARRSRGSRIGAHASLQSRIIGGRDELQARVAKFERQFAGADIPRPQHWGGYCLKPASIEFWQARRNRLHDRLRYRRTHNAWHLERLAP